MARIFFCVFLLAPLRGFSGVSLQAPALEDANRKEVQAFFEKSLTTQVDEAALSDLIRRAYFKWPIYSIEVESENDVDWVVRIQPRQTVDSVTIKKSSKLVSKGEILDRVNIRPGDRITPADLPALERDVAAHYVYRGFPHAKVRARLVKVKNSEGVRLSMAITEGDPCLLTSTQAILERPVGDPVDLSDRFRTQKGDRCDARLILASEKRLTDELREDGYLSLQSKKPELIYSEDRTSATLRLAIESGPRILIRFSGNTFAFERDSKMKDAIGYSDEKEFNTSWIEFRAKEGIKNFYKKSGYAKPEISVEDAWSEDRSQRTLLFRIDRGAKYRLGKVAFDGERGVGEKRLQKEFKAAYQPETSRSVYVESAAVDATDGLLNFYQEKGYLRAKIDPPTASIKRNYKVNLVFRVEEGLPSTLLDYKIAGNAVFTNAEVAQFMKIRPSDPINPGLLRRQADALEARYQKMGYKFAKVKLPKVESLDAGPVQYLVEIDEGKQVRFGQVAILGNAVTKDRVIRRELEIKPGQLYQPQKIRDSRRKLLQLGFFNSVSIDELPVVDSTQTEDIVVKVSERKSRSVIFRPGYSTDDGLRAAAEFRYVNLLGTGRNFNSYARVNRRFDTGNNILERRIVLTYLEPYLIDRINGKVTFIQERVDEQQFDLDRTSFSLGLERQFFSWIRASTAWELEFRSPFNELEGAVLNPIDQTRARFGSIQTQLDLDLRDDVLNPIEGSFHRIQVDMYNKGLLSDADFYQVYLRNNFYHPIYKRLRTVLSLRLGFSSTYGQTKEEQVPIEKRFRIGGNSSFRGAGFNCIGGITDGSPENCSDVVSSQAPGGNALFNYMFDFLIPITKDLDLALFTDGGNAFLSNRGYNILDIRNSAGVGFRYNTFFGPMRFDYGILLDRRSGEKFGAFHFAVGQF